VTLWSGRVESELAPEVWDFLHAEDTELLPYDCQATATHARRLQQAGLLSDAELAEVEAALGRIAAEGIDDEADEDVHSALERALGEVGRKLHAGRSRNDQVAAALRLYVADACDEAVTAIRSLAEVVLDRAEEEAQTPMPAYTHLQRAQPVTVGHHLLAWVEMLARDLKRFRFAAEQARPSPLGSAAVAGSTLELLPPPGPRVHNSMDAVGDRDFALDYLYAWAVLGTHLSRMGEELVLWATSEFGFVQLPEGAATGSSMMPQKLNPDVAELVRGKAGTAIGRLTGLLATIKGLPLAYNRDLQEDKASVFAARRDVRGMLAALEVLIAGIEFNHERLRAATADPLLQATDAAEALVESGVPFRDAHEQIAGQVRAGTFEPEEPRPRLAPGPAEVSAAVAEARARVL
jgi:argininosuccinate lyase